MPKSTIYTQSGYTLSFGADDFLTLDVKLKINKLTENTFEVEILECSLSPVHMEFACFLVKLLQTEELKSVYNEIHTRLKEEITPNLFTLFYVGEPVPDEPQN